MNCDEALGAFASHLDGEELADGDAAALDAHLAECAMCRAQARKLAETHRDLLMLRATKGRTPQRRTGAVVRCEPPAACSSQPPRRYSIWVEAAAAVLLAAILAFLLWPKGQPLETGQQKIGQMTAGVPRVAQVVAAQGRVESKAAGAVAPVVLETGAEVPAGQEIHVGQASFAELDMHSGVRVRLEPVSVMRFDVAVGPDGVMLVSGKGRFEVTTRDAPWRLQTPNATVESKGGVFVVTVKE